VNDESAGTAGREQCLLLAQSGHCHRAERCPLFGVKRTLRLIRSMSAFDPKWTWHPFGATEPFTPHFYLRHAINGAVAGVWQELPSPRPTTFDLKH
jgi:hypothetical protein